MRIFKMILVMIISLTCFYSFGNKVDASENLYVDSIVFDGDKIEYYEQNVTQQELEYGDSFINKEDIETGLNIQEKMNSSRMNEEVWSLQSSVTHKAYGAIRGKFNEKLSAGTSSNKTAVFNFNVSKIVKYNITLSASAKFTFSYTRNGPTGTEAVGNKKATHRYFVGVGSGKIMKYTFRITDKYSGRFIRNQVSYVATNLKSEGYGILGYLDTNKSEVTIRSIKNSTTRKYKESDFISKVNSENCWNIINF